eukprot:g49360.t1
MANIWTSSGQFAQTSRRRVGANVLTKPKCYFASNDWCFSARYAILSNIASCKIKCYKVPIITQISSTMDIRTHRNGFPSIIANRDLSNAPLPTKTVMEKDKPGRPPSLPTSSDGKSVQAPSSGLPSMPLRRRVAGGKRVAPPFNAENQSSVRPDDEHVYERRIEDTQMELAEIEDKRREEARTAGGQSEVVSTGEQKDGTILGPVLAFVSNSLGNTPARRTMPRRTSPMQRFSPGDTGNTGFEQFHDHDEEAPRQTPRRKENVDKENIDKENVDQEGSGTTHFGLSPRIKIFPTKASRPEPEDVQDSPSKLRIPSPYNPRQVKPVDGDVRAMMQHGPPEQADGGPECTPLKSTLESDMDNDVPKTVYFGRCEARRPTTAEEEKYFSEQESVGYERDQPKTAAFLPSNLRKHWKTRKRAVAFLYKGKDDEQTIDMTPDKEKDKTDKHDKSQDQAPTLGVPKTFLRQASKTFLSRPNPKKGANISKNRHLIIWLLALQIGIGVSMLTNLIMASSRLAVFKVNFTKELMSASDWHYVWAVWMGSALIFGTLAIVLVLSFPGSGGSGIPQVLSFLNGIEPTPSPNACGKRTDPHGVATLFAKVFGLVFSLLSGLCIGPEGPVIHIGAMGGLAAVRLISRENWRKSWDDMFQRRDFFAVGAGCGIASAFQAPMAGLVFVAEEGSSFLSFTLFELAFVAAVVAYFLTWIITHYAFGGMPLGPRVDPHATPYCPGPTSFFRLNDFMLFLCTSISFFRLNDFMLFLCTSICGGLVGAAFNGIVTAATKFRNRWIKNIGWRLAFEAMLLMLVSAVVRVGFSETWGCRPLTTSGLLKNSPGCMSKPMYDSISLGFVSEAYNLSAQERMWVESMDPYGVAETLLMKPGLTHVQPPPNIMQGSCPDGTYNEMATLFLQSGSRTVSLFFMSGLPDLFSYQALMLFFVFYFFLSSITSGLAVPAGMFVPQMLLGSSMGRLLVALDTWFLRQWCGAVAPWRDVTTITGLEWAYGGYRHAMQTCQFPNPAVYSIYGAASVLGGSGRITVFLALVILELVNDMKLLPMVAASVVIAIVIATFLNQGMYHSMLKMSAVPFMSSQPASIMHVHPVGLVMSSKLVVLTLHCSIEDMKQALKTSHNAFPVVQRDPNGPKPIPQPKKKHERQFSLSLPYKYSRTLPYKNPSASFNLKDGDKKGKGDTSTPATPKSLVNRLRGKDDTVSEKGSLASLRSGSSVPKAPSSSPQSDSRSHSMQDGQGYGQLVGMITRGALREHLANMEHMSSLGMYDPEEAAAQLLTHMHAAPLTVYNNISIARAYDLYRKNSLRHLCVIDLNGNLVGILTRKDLMRYRVEEAVQEKEAREAKKKATKRAKDLQHKNGEANGNSLDSNHDWKHTKLNPHREAESGNMLHPAGAPGLTGMSTQPKNGQAPKVQRGLTDLFTRPAGQFTRPAGQLSPIPANEPSSVSSSQLPTPSPNVPDSFLRLPSGGSASNLRPGVAGGATSAKAQAAAVVAAGQQLPHKGPARIAPEAPVSPPVAAAAEAGSKGPSRIAPDPPASNSPPTAVSPRRTPPLPLSQQQQQQQHQQQEQEPRSPARSLAANSQGPTPTFASDGSTVASLLRAPAPLPNNHHHPPLPSLLPLLLLPPPNSHLQTRPLQR